MMMTSSFEAFCNRVTAVTTKKGTSLCKKKYFIFLKQKCLYKRTSEKPVTMVTDLKNRTVKPNFCNHSPVTSGYIRLQRKE